MSNSPHQRNLRKGRFSEKGKAYSLTKCTAPEVSLTNNSHIANLLIETFFWMDSQKRFSPGAFVIMPDHYHIVMTLNEQNTLSAVMKSISSFTSREINKALGRTGQLWKKGYYDRAIRKTEDIKEIFDYIHNNPVRKGLVDHPEEWPYSSMNSGYYKRVRWQLFM